MSYSTIFLNGSPQKILGVPIDELPLTDNPMTGCYSAALKNSRHGQEVIVIGGGEVYQKMIGPALNFLGIKVHLYDPNSNVAMVYGETRLLNPEQSPKRIPAFILSPNKYHAGQARFFIERGQHVAVEKPACLPEDVEDLRELVFRSDASSYWIDFNHMMGRSLISLAAGVKMPFIDNDAIDIMDDPTNRIATSLQSNTPLIDGNITRVTARYFQAGNAPGGNFAGKTWQMDYSQGGGIMRDLMTRLFNITQLIGLNAYHITSADLRLADPDEHGKYTPITSAYETEQYSEVKGIMLGDAGKVYYDFAVAKYAATNDLALQLEYDTGDKLTLEWQPPHRKNTVTWHDSEGNVAGKVVTRTDPYMLIVLDALSHFESGGATPLYFAEQINSVVAISKAAAFGRQHLLEPYNRNMMSEANVSGPNF